MKEKEPGDEGAVSRNKAIGGHARALALTSEERTAIARKAAAGRWGKTEEVPYVEFGTDDHPLIIADVEIPCYVLSNGQRVISQRGLIRALSMATGALSGADRLMTFASGRRVKDFVAPEIMEMIQTPVRFRGPTGPVTYGYDAAVLVGLCEAVVAADRAGVLQRQQRHIAHRASILHAAFARVGLVALIDEVTGYQAVRQKDELRKVLEAYVNPLFLPWTRQFPDEYFEQLFRLNGYSKYDERSKKRPKYFGKLTEDVIYKRLPIGVLDELRKVNPKNAKGNRTRRHHQHLTEDIGHRHLRDHLISVVTLMRAAPNWRVFKQLLDRSLPLPNSQTELQGFGFDERVEPE